MFERLHKGLLEPFPELLQLQTHLSTVMCSEYEPGAAATARSFCCFFTRAFFRFKLTSLTVPEFVYLSAFLPVCLSLLMSTNSMSSPASFRDLSSPNDVVQQPISFGPFFDQWLTVIFKCLEKADWFKVLKS